MKVPREPGREVEREAAPAPAPRQAPADRVLALQTTAGNRAVAAMLAREPDTAVPADSKGPPPKTPAAPSGPHIVLGGIGAIALESWSLLSTGPGGGRGGTGRGREGDRQQPSEISFTSKQGEHSARLAQAAATGRPMDGEIIVGGMKIVFKGAMVSNYTVSSVGGDKEPLESWTINVQSLEFVMPKEGDEKGPQPDRGAWDLAPGKGA